MVDITAFGDHVRQLKILKQMCFLVRKQGKKWVKLDIQLHVAEALLLFLKGVVNIYDWCKELSLDCNVGSVFWL